MKDLELPEAIGTVETNPVFPSNTLENERRCWTPPKKGGDFLWFGWFYAFQVLFLRFLSEPFEFPMCKIASCYLKDRKITGYSFKYLLLFSPKMGKIPILTNIFQRGWNRQLGNYKIVQASNGQYTARISQHVGMHRQNTGNRKELNLQFLVFQAGCCVSGWVTFSIFHCQSCFKGSVPRLTVLLLVYFCSASLSPVQCSTAISQRVVVYRN